MFDFYKTSRLIAGINTSLIKNCYLQPNIARQITKDNDALLKAIYQTSKLFNLSIKETTVVSGTILFSYLTSTSCRHIVEMGRTRCIAMHWYNSFLVQLKTSKNWEDMSNLFDITATLIFEDDPNANIDTDNSDHHPSNIDLNEIIKSTEQLEKKLIEFHKYDLAQKKLGINF